jgi:hypothetical protein
MASNEQIPRMWEGSGVIQDYRNTHLKQIHDWESEGGSLGRTEEQATTS